MEKRVVKKSVKFGVAAAILVLLAAGVSVYAAGVNGGANGNISEVKKEQPVKVDDQNSSGKEVVVDGSAPAALSEISLDEAKSIALAQVSGASSADISKAYKDYDDGRAEYDIEIKYNGYEYDFEISAESGKILGKDVDRIEFDDYDDRYDD